MQKYEYFQIKTGMISQEERAYPETSFLLHPDLIVAYEPTTHPLLTTALKNPLGKRYTLVINDDTYNLLDRHRGPRNRNNNNNISITTAGFHLTRTSPTPSMIKDPLYYVFKEPNGYHHPKVISMYTHIEDGCKDIHYTPQQRDFIHVTVNKSEVTDSDRIKVYITLKTIKAEGTKRFETTPAVITDYTYDKYLISDDKGKMWSLPQTRTASYSQDYLKEQIRARYGFFNRPASGLSNVVIDSYYPGLLYANDCSSRAVLATTTLPKTAVAISEFIANSMNIKKVPVEQLCRVLGYQPKQIKELLTKTKRRNLTMIFAGAGGTGINTAYWLKELTEMTNTVNLFKTVHIYEKDSIEFSNTLRFPIDIRKFFGNTIDYNTFIEKSNTKMLLAQSLVKNLSKNRISVFNRYITDHSSIDWELRNDSTDKLTLNPDVFLYGAPEIAYRNPLSKIGNFICATHAATTCSMWLNPKQELDLQVESYGMIQLGGFFMNQLKMAITLLELLASEVDLSQEDISVLEYEFDGTILGTTDRQYNWQIDRNLLMMTEEQANNI